MKSKRKAEVSKALHAVKRLRELADRYGGPTKDLSEEEILRSIKKVREEFWDKRLASRS